MQIIDSVQLDFSDVLIKPRRSSIDSRSKVDITREYKFKWCPYVIKGTGIMQANMGTIGNFNVSRKMLENGLFACLHKYHSVEDLIEFYGELYDKYVHSGDKSLRRCLLGIGLRDDGIEKLRVINKALGIQVGVKFDVPNGYIPQVKEKVIELRKEFPEMFIMVGNVVTGDITEDLILSGADCVAVGIGPGGQCLTRPTTGCGRPQLSAIIECADAAHQVGGMVCADGGITCPGDLGKAFGAGADFIMIGSLFAGTDEADGEIISKWIFNGEYEPAMDGSGFEPCLELKEFKQFYGMSSTLAQEKFGNGKPKYRASEGRVSLVPYVGSIDGVIEELLGGLRSTMTYIGAWKLKNIPKQCTFYKVHNQLNRTYERYTIGK
jgi:GMP reductase